MLYITATLKPKFSRIKTQYVSIISQYVLVIIIIIIMIINSCETHNVSNVNTTLKMRWWWQHMKDGDFSGVI